MSSISSILTVVSSPPSSPPAKLPIFKIMAGNCEGVITSVQVRVPCPCVGFEGLSQPGQLDVPCIVCGHPLSQHRSTSLADRQPEMGSAAPLQQHREAGPAEDDTATGPNLASVYPRPDTVEKLAELVDQQKIVLVRGTPSSGKTMLAFLLRNYYASRKKNVCLVRLWKSLSTYGPESADPLALLAKMLYYERAGPADRIIPGTIILVDEAQASYSDVDFWNHVIKDILQGCSRADLKLCLFSSYGSPSTGVERVIYHPATFMLKQRVTLTIQPNGPQLALFFNKAEAYHAIDSIIKHRYYPQLLPTFDNNAKEYLFLLTNGHPGAIEALIVFTIERCFSSIKHDDTIITKDKILESMENEDIVWNCLTRVPNLRSLPRGELFTPGARETLACVLEKGNIQPDEANKDLQTCYKQGWLHKMEIESDPTCPVVYVLPSRLHEKWVEYLIGKENRLLPPQFQTLQQLVMPILKGVSTINLKNLFEGKVLSSAACYRPVEAQYQDEFYRSFNKVVGRGVPISSEWSRTRHGRIDFRIPERRWAIELLRDHDEIGEHIARFHKGGKYYNWTVDGTVRDWIVINCAITMPKNVFSEPKLIHAIFDPDYKGVRLLDNRLNLLGHHVLTN
ncbi:hypothetical protein BJX63DRAFT_280234 [Aspergillus granulosus]|uniref:AAA+ ATPase domain-containing protein n=1 Tax=Aspergillus granulosus TaxID=176169 RepID=A0ABR4HYU0_9EURO